MLQKLLIALCTIFVLTACGGDDDASQEPIVLNPPEDLNSGEEEDEEEGETEEDGPSWLSQQFETDTSASWSFACVSGCDTTAELAHNTDEQTLNVTPTWGAAEDQIEVSATIDPAVADLTAGNAHLNLYVPASYTDAGTVNAQVFFVNAADAKGYLGFMAVSAGWNTFSFTDIQLGTGDEGSFGYQTEAFTLENIKAIGVQVDPADGTSLVDVNGTLQIDDAIVSPEAIEVADKGGEEEPTGEEPIAGAPVAPTAGDISDHFTDDIAGWHLNGTGDTTTTETDQIALTHDAVNGALKITPKSWEASASEGYRYESRLAFDAADLSNALVRMVVYIPEAYVTDGGLELQLVAGGSYGDYIPELTAGFNTLDIDLSQRTDDLTAVETLGVQLAVAPTDTSILEPILVSSVDVYLDGTEPANTQSVPVDGGWTSDSTPTTFSYDNGVVMTPDWSAGDEQKGYVLVDSPVDLTDATITYVVDVPEAYVTDGGMVIQPFSQQNSGDYEGIFDGSISGGWNAASDLQAGENTIVHGPFTAPPADIERIGLSLLKQDKADGVTGDVTIRSITITYPQ